MDKGGRDHEGAEPGPARTEREIDILAIGEQARVECAHRADHRRVDQHGATRRVVDVGRRAVGLHLLAPARVAWPAAPWREFAAAIPDLVDRFLEGIWAKESPPRVCSGPPRPGCRDSAGSPPRRCSGGKCSQPRRPGRLRFPNRTLLQSRGCEEGGGSRPAGGPLCGSGVVQRASVVDEEDADRRVRRLSEGFQAGLGRSTSSPVEHDDSHDRHSP